MHAASTTPEIKLLYGCSTVVLICFTCPAITVVTVILRALDRVCESSSANSSTTGVQDLKPPKPSRDVHWEMPQCLERVSKSKARAPSTGPGSDQCSGIGHFFSTCWTQSSRRRGSGFCWGLALRCHGSPPRPTRVDGRKITARARARSSVPGTRFLFLGAKVGEGRPGAKVGGLEDRVRPRVPSIQTAAPLQAPGHLRRLPRRRRRFLRPACACRADPDAMCGGRADGDVEKDEGGRARERVAEACNGGGDCERTCQQQDEEEGRGRQEEEEGGRRAL